MPASAPSIPPLQVSDERHDHQQKLERLAEAINVLREDLTDVHRSAKRQQAEQRSHAALRESQFDIKLERMRASTRQHIEARLASVEVGAVALLLHWQRRVVGGQWGGPSRWRMIVAQ